MPGPSSILSRLRSRKSLAFAFATSGVIHLVAPKVFEGIVPRWLPRARALVYVSGVAELICAAGLVAEAEWAGPASAGVLLAVWPANIQMAIDSTRGRQPLLRQLAAWGRVPLQIPMIRLALSKDAPNRI